MTIQPTTKAVIAAAWPSIRAWRSNSLNIRAPHAIHENLSSLAYVRVHYQPARIEASAPLPSPTDDLKDGRR